MPVNDQIRNKLSEVPHRPGVYLHKDRFGTVVYVGKARDLRRRVSQYFHPSRRMGWDLKFNALVDAIHDFDWHVVKSEAEALLLEGKLIKDFKPRFNIDFRDDKRFLLLKVNLNDPIPRFTLTRFRKDDGGLYFGPFAHSGSLRRTMTMLRRKFHLRGCRALTPAEADYKHCLFANVKNCTAPCIGNVTRDEYLGQVRAACEFLEGHTDEMRAELEEEMKKAALALEFEKAAQLRDALDDLKKTTQQTEKFERVPYKLPMAINPEADMRELGRILGLPAAPSRIEGFDISNISGTFMVASMVSFWCGRPDRSNYRRFKMKSVTAQNDFACMAETIKRRYSRLQREIEGRPPEPEEVDDAVVVVAGAVLPPDGELDAPWVPKPSKRMTFPDLILIDGGRGQLNAACEQLALLGLGHIPIIGLAKEYEEIYRPEEANPLRLGLDNSALKLLQRVRDESHRFANTYNAQLRLKKISESILDDFPGIGDSRKQALLKKFGSVERIRRASLEQISEVSGFGGETAAKLKAFLDARDSVRGVV